MAKSVGQPVLCKNLNASFLPFSSEWIAKGLGYLDSIMLSLLINPTTPLFSCMLGSLSGCWKHGLILDSCQDIFAVHEDKLVTKCFGNLNSVLLSGSGLGFSSISKWTWWSCASWPWSFFSSISLLYFFPEPWQVVFFKCLLVSELIVSSLCPLNDLL